MAVTHEYMKALDSKISISPAGSQEELLASQTIGDLMAEQGARPQVEEFDTRSFAKLVPAGLLILMFLGIFLAGMGVMFLTALGFVLVAGPVVLFVLKEMGTDVISTLGPATKSQNVVAFHRGSGPEVQKGTRPVVIVAHYDTPHENPLYSSPVAPYLPMIHMATRYCFPAVAVCTFFQLLAFLPEVFRRFLWVVGIIAALPLLFVAVSEFVEHFSPCGVGANDNKSGVAALLACMAKVRANGSEEPFVVDLPEDEPLVSAHPAAVAADEAEADAEAEVAPAVELPTTKTVMVPAEEVLGVRHGEEVLRSLGMLPEDCQIEYVEPQMVATEVPLTEDEISAMTAAVSVAAPAADETAPAAAVATVERVDAGVAANDTFEFVVNDFASIESEGSSSDDASGLEVETDDPGATVPTAPIAVEKPAAPEDPAWGKTSFRPQVSSVARRASLFDLPDPSAATHDPFESTNPAAAPVAPTQPKPQAAPAYHSFDSEQFPALTDVPDVPVISADEPVEEEPQGFLGKLKGKMSGWKGGATTRSGLRMVEGGEGATQPEAESEDEVVFGGEPDAVVQDDAAAEGVSSEFVASAEDAAAEDVFAEDVPTEDDLRDAVLAMNDDLLVCHDIWFVALGASDLNHAGMEDFLSRHRSDCRGAFVINLDCVGAGELSIISHEGLTGTRRSDRRMTRLLGKVAADMHLELGKHQLNWCDTDATPAMRRSMRSITLMGVNESGLPALSRTPDDIVENVSVRQTSAVAEMVCEMIRRS